MTASEVYLSGPADIPTGCGGLSMDYADATLANEAAYLRDYEEAEFCAADPGVASDVLDRTVTTDDLNHPDTGSDLRRTVTLRLLARAGWQA